MDNPLRNTKQEGQSHGPLHGVRVLDLSWLLPGPFCTHVLVELGADVIKVERPGSGDYLREILPSAYALINKGKRSITVNLKSESGWALFDQLLKDSDIVVEGFRPGVAAKLGIDYASMSMRHPQIIYASISGYGQNGPLALQPGHDINYLALGGALSIPAHWEESPRRSGLPVGDLSASLYAVINIMAALRNRDSSGRGTHIDLSIAESVLHWSQVRLADHAQPHGEWHHVRPGNDIFTTSDGQQIAMGLVEEKFWCNFGEACGWPEAAQIARDFECASREDARQKLGSNLHAELARHIRQHDLAHWKRILQDGDIPFSVVNGPAEVFVDPHFVQRGIVSEITGQAGRTIGAVALPGGLYAGSRLPAPRLDEHGGAIRSALMKAAKTDDASTANQETHLAAT